jgi:uncharacterized protein YdeI (YjbR/CyaY-like superfamily)
MIRMASPETHAGLPILAFADRAAFEVWLAAAPPAAPGLWLKLAKQGSGLASLSKAEAIDATLCHGWIDGQLHPYDESCWLVRFTPRKPRSKWSQKNRDRAEQLIAEGRMAPRGLAEVEAAKAEAAGTRLIRRPVGPRCLPICGRRSTRTRGPRPSSPRSRARTATPSSTGSAR